VAASRAFFRSFATHVVLPVSVGAVVYLAFRDRDLLVFRLATALGWTQAVDTLRNAATNLRPSGFLLFSLPDALWVYGATSWMLLIWRTSSAVFSVPWIYAGAALALGGEVGQAAGVVPGTFDVADIAACVGAAVISLLILGVRRHEP